MRLIDLSHVITAGMTTCPGLPGPVIEEHLSFEESHGNYAAGTEFSIGRISMVANTGTYLDTPAHRYRGGHDLAGLPLERRAGLPAVVVDVEEYAIGPGQLPDSVNIDDTTGGERPAHTVLLAAEVLVVEHLTNLSALPERGAVFSAVPPAIGGMATFPVRAYAAVA